MKIVSFTMVNNESEIIESFIRYNYNFFDDMIIIDNGSTDSTVDIINNLIDDGFRIILYDESLEPYNQFALDNKYLDLTIKQLNPDIIIPLDADEFITGDENPRNLLESLDLNCIYYVHWQWYVLTEKTDMSKDFIPERLTYCFDKFAWNYSDGKPVTKTIIPANYFSKNHLKLSMGHHKVFGNNNVKIKEINNIFLAHYRIISTNQLIYKTCCYTLRDIATMTNNVETAQRTNQMFMIENGDNLKEAAIKASYGGYSCKIVHSPLKMDYCKKDSNIIQYKKNIDDMLMRIMKTGREMAIRVYNLERERKEKCLLDPIVICLDGVRGDECIFPNPSNHITIMTSMYNVRGYFTTHEEIRMLKVNYRLIVTSKELKFLPYKYLIIPKTLNYDKTSKRLIKLGVPSNKIISEEKYKKTLSIFLYVYIVFRFLPSVIYQFYLYSKRNGYKETIKKVKSRF